MILLVLIVAISFSLLGCIDIAVDIVLNDDHSGNIEVRYTLDTELFRIGGFDSISSTPIIPIAKPDIERVARSIDGLTLINYRLTEDEEQSIVSYRLNFESGEALAQFYAPYSSSIKIEDSRYRQLIFDNAIGGQAIIPAPPSPRPQTYQFEALADRLLGDSQLSFSFRAPDSITRVSTGSFTERVATWSEPLNRLVKRESPLWWEIYWENPQN